jgi:hypothetical protein
MEHGTPEQIQPTHQVKSPGVRTMYVQSESAPQENHAQITSDIVSERQGIQSTKIQNEKMSEHKKNQD